MKRTIRIWFALLVFFSFSLYNVHARSAPTFTVTDEVGLTSLGIFGNTNPANVVRFSPDKKYVAVFSIRGRLELNRVENSLRFYRTSEIEHFLQHVDASRTPAPLWVITLSSREDGAIDQNWRWLPNSSGIAFLEGTDDGSQRLALANIYKKTIEFLTSSGENVSAFDVRDRQHYVYTTIPYPGHAAQGQAPALVATGLSLLQLIFSNDSRVQLALSSNRFLWAVIAGKRSKIMPITDLAGDEYALSPDAHSLVIVLPVHIAPPSWEKLYSSFFAIPTAKVGLAQSAHEYTLVNLQNGSRQPLTDAPYAGDEGWAIEAAPSWSDDGQAILLPGTFLGSQGPMQRPCVAFVDLRSDMRMCIEMLKGETKAGHLESGFRFDRDIHFVGDDKQHVMVSFINNPDYSFGSVEYQRTSNGWKVIKQFKGLEEETGLKGLEVTVSEGLNDPQRLVAINNQRPRVIWDPNPQLKKMALSQASVYTWQDKEGRNWRGGLYLPRNLEPRRRYPLVIQTHGFSDSKFLPSGLYPTGMAAQVLAASGIVVLQVGGPCPLATPDEGPCYVSGYEAVVHKLVAQGLVDPNEIGIVGFSRSCFHAMEAITSSSLHIKAALVTDGITANYDEAVLFEAYPLLDSLIGAPPFGAGLQQWLKRSPGFNLDKVTAAVMVVAEGQPSLLSMWQPYSVLHYLHKPVDLVMLNTQEHVLTNPVERMVSQGESVDWFRFWLQSYKDPNPAKRAQYTRWEGLQTLREAQ